MPESLKELIGHFSKANNCPTESKHAFGSKKFLIISLFVIIATAMQYIGKFTGSYPDFMTNMCITALFVFAYQDKKQIEAKGNKDAE